MIEVQILIPNADNNSVPFPPATDAQFLIELDRLFNGSSVLPGLISGRWVSGGQTFPDQNRVFAVFVGGVLADGAKVLEAVEFAKVLYGQLAITVRYLNMVEIF